MENKKITKIVKEPSSNEVKKICQKTKKLRAMPGYPAVQPNRGQGITIIVPGNTVDKIAISENNGGD